MTTPHSVDPEALLEQHPASASLDLLREMIVSFANVMMSAQADQVCGAGYGERSSARVNRRKGYRARDPTNQTMTARHRLRNWWSLAPQSDVVMSKVPSLTGTRGPEADLHRSCLCAVVASFEGLPRGRATSGDLI